MTVKPSSGRAYGPNMFAIIGRSFKAAYMSIVYWAVHFNSFHALNTFLLLCI